VYSNLHVIIGDKLVFILGILAFEANRNGGHYNSESKKF